MSTPLQKNTTNPCTLSAIAPVPVAWASTPMPPAPRTPGPVPPLRPSTAALPAAPVLVVVPDRPWPAAAFSPRTPAAVALSVKPRMPSRVRANPLVDPLWPYTPVAWVLVLTVPAPVLLPACSAVSLVLVADTPQWLVLVPATPMPLPLVPATP